MAHQPWATAPHLQVGVDQRPRIDLEMRVRRGMDIDGEPLPVDRGLAPEQQPARLARMRGAGLAQHRLQNRACHLDGHRACP